MGTSGGILLIWDRRLMEKIEECVDNFLVACKFISVNDQFEWAFASVYGPNSDVDSSCYGRSWPV